MRLGPVLKAWRDQPPRPPACSLSRCAWGCRDAGLALSSGGQPRLRAQRRVPGQARRGGGGAERWGAHLLGRASSPRLPLSRPCTCARHPPSTSPRAADTPRLRPCPYPRGALQPQRDEEGRRAAWAPPCQRAGWVAHSPDASGPLSPLQRKRPWPGGGPRLQSRRRCLPAAPQEPPSALVQGMRVGPASRAAAWRQAQPGTVRVRREPGRRPSDLPASPSGPGAGGWTPPRSPGQRQTQELGAIGPGVGESMQRALTGRPPPALPAGTAGAASRPPALTVRAGGLSNIRVTSPLLSLLASAPGVGGVLSFPDNTPMWVPKVTQNTAP